MRKATFIDFDDSFSYNVVQELTEVGFQVEVIHWMDFESLPEIGLLVLGPGPGHPDDYQRVFSLLKEWIQNQKPLLGICLGHQLFWKLQGEEVIRSREPLHGQKIKLQLSEEWQQWLKLPEEVLVQRYNSLSVPAQAGMRNPFFKNLIVNEEILITRGDKVITYQFHPESVGTSYRQAFFEPVYRDLV